MLIYIIELTPAMDGAGQMQEIEVTPVKPVKSSSVSLAN